MESLIAFGVLFSLLMGGGEVQSAVTISGIVLTGDDSRVFDEYRGGLCATSRVLFGRIVRTVLLSELNESV